VTKKLPDPKTERDARLSEIRQRIIRDDPTFIARRAAGERRARLLAEGAMVPTPASLRGRSRELAAWLLFVAGSAEISEPMLEKARRVVDEWLRDDAREAWMPLLAKIVEPYRRTPKFDAEGAGRAIAAALVASQPDAPPQFRRARTADVYRRAGDAAVDRGAGQGARDRGAWRRAVEVAKVFGVVMPEREAFATHRKTERRKSVRER
jgi:hypothetical protein